MRGTAKLEDQVRQLALAALGPTFNVDGHAKLLATRHGNHELGAIRQLILQELRSRKELTPT